MSGSRATSSDLKWSVMDEMKEKNVRPRSMPPECIASLDNNNHKPNMIFSSRSGSFIRSRQNRLLRVSSSGHPPDSGLQSKRQVKKPRPMSANETEIEKFSNSSRDKKPTSSSKSNVKSMRATATAEISRRPSQGEIFHETKSQASGILNKSRSNSRGNLKLNEMPTASLSISNARAMQTPATAEINRRLSQGETFQEKHSQSSGFLNKSRSNSRGNLKLNLMPTASSSKSNAPLMQTTATVEINRRPSQCDISQEKRSQSSGSLSRSRSNSKGNLKSYDMATASSSKSNATPMQTKATVEINSRSGQGEISQEKRSQSSGSLSRSRSNSKGNFKSYEMPTAASSARQINVETNRSRSASLVELPMSPVSMIEKNSVPLSDVSRSSSKSSLKSKTQLRSTISREKASMPPKSIGPTEDSTSIKYSSNSFAKPAEDKRSSNSQFDQEYKPTSRHHPKPAKKSEIPYKNETDSEEEYQEVTETIIVAPTENRHFSKNQFDQEYKPTLEHSQKPPEIGETSYNDEIDSEEEYREITETIIVTPIASRLPSISQIDEEYKSNVEHSRERPKNREISYNEEIDPEEEYQEITETIIVTPALSRRPSNNQFDEEYNLNSEYLTKSPKKSEISYNEIDSEEEYQEITETFVTPAASRRTSVSQFDGEYKPNSEHSSEPLKMGEIVNNNEIDSEEEYQEITETFITPTASRRPSVSQRNEDYKPKSEDPQQPKETNETSSSNELDSEEEYQEITETIIVTPASSRHPSTSQFDEEHKPTSKHLPKLQKTSDADSGEEYQEITETITVTMPQPSQSDSYSAVHQGSPPSKVSKFRTEPNQAFYPINHFQSAVAGSRSVDSHRSQPAFIQDGDRMTSTSVAGVSTSVDVRTSISIPVQDKTQASPTSNEVLDYFNTTLARYASSRSRTPASGTDSQSYDSRDYSKEEIMSNTSGDSVFSNSRRLSTASTDTLTGHSGSESDAELSSQDERSQDLSGLSRHRNSEAQIQSTRVTANFAPASHSKGHKRKKKHRAPKVIKYEDDVESIRQHIKPGTVEGLTHLFDESEIRETQFLPQRSQNLSREHVFQNEPEAFYRGSSKKESEGHQLDNFSGNGSMIAKATHIQENSVLSKSQRERRDKEIYEKSSNIKATVKSHYSPYYPYPSDNNIETTMASREPFSRTSYVGEECENKGNANVLVNLYLNSQNTINDDKWPRNSLLDSQSASGGLYVNASKKWNDSPLLSNVIVTNQAHKNDVTSDSNIHHIDTRNQHNFTNKEVYSSGLDTTATVAPNPWAGMNSDPSHKSSFYHVTNGTDSTGDTQPRYEAQSRESGVGVKGLLKEYESRLKSGTEVDGVLLRRRWDTPQEIVLSQEYEVQGHSLRRKRRLKLSHREDDPSSDSMSIHSTGSTGGESLSSVASWTTLDDIAAHDAMIDHLKDPLYEKSSRQTDSTITSAEHTRETTLLVNGGDGNNNGTESKTAFYSSKRNFSRTESGHASLSNGHTSHPVTNDYEIGEVQVNSQMDEGKAISKTEQERQAERTDNVITQLPTDLSSQTTGVNLFAHTASREMERGGKGRTEDTSDNEDENERRERQTHGAVTVDRKAHLGQISSSFTSAQVEINETHSKDETQPSQVGVSQLDDFNAILSGLDLNAVSDSQLSPSENTYNEEVISYEDYSLENRSQNKDSMKNKKNVKKSSSSGSDRNKVVTSNVSLIKDTYVSGQQLDQLDKTISDDDTGNGATKKSHGSIDDEIRELHLQLSPGISNNIVEETTFNLAQTVESNRGSLSSQSSSRRNQTPQRETVFNRDFFTSGHNIREERNESDVQFGLDDNDNENQRFGLTLSNSRDGAEISYSPEGERDDSSKANGQVTNSDITRQSSTFRQRNLPVNEDETDTLLQTRKSDIVEVGGINEERKDSEDSDSISSHSSKSETGNVLKSSKKSLTGGDGYLPLKVNSARSQVYEVSRGSDFLHSSQQHISLTSDDHPRDQKARKSGSTSSLSSVTSYSDSDERGAVPGSYQSGKRKKKHRKSDIFEISKTKDDDFTTGDGEVKRNIFVPHDHVRSISSESGHADNKQTGSSTKVSIETDEEYLVEKRTGTEEEKNMAAIVGEVSSFNIHRKVTSVEESSTVPSDHSTRSQIQTMPVEGGAQPDIFLIQDKSGDVYALQEVSTTNSSSTTQSVTTIHSVKRDDYSTQATSVQPALYSGGNYQTDHVTTDADIFVDSASVNDDKAREVIAAYLNSGSNTVVNQSVDADVNRGISSHSQFYSGAVVDNYSRQLDDSRLNTSDSVFVNSAAPSNAATSPHSIVVHQGMRENEFLKNSTITVNEDVNAKTDTSQTWNIHGYEPYTTGSGGEGGYKSSLIVTNFNTPQQQAQVTYSSQPRVDTTLESQRSNSLINTSQTASAFQPLNVNVSPDQGVAPFATRPITIQTTTNAVVGEKVDMTIDFPPGEQRHPSRKITATAELATSSSDDENKSRYVIRSAPQKSSLKSGSVHNSRNTSFDSNPDLLYTKKETLTGEIVIGGKKKGTGVFDSRKEKRYASARSGSLSPSSANSSTYIMRQNLNRDMESNRRDQRQEAHKVRRVNKSSYKHHSPERIFVNPQLSLRRPAYEEKSASSDEETQNKRYKTVTRVVVDGENRSRSSSSSPTNQYRILNRKSRGDDVQSFDGKSYQIVTVKSRGHKDSGSGSFSENDSEMEMSEQRRLYKVVNKSDLVINKHDVRAQSSPNPEKINSSKSIEEAVIHRTERVQPSKYQRRPSSKSSHKTVIQLEVGDQNRIKEKSRSESQTSGSTIGGMARAKSLDALNSRENYTFNRSMDNERTWRTSRARSVDSSSDGSSSSDFEGSGPFNLSSSGLVKTLKQKKGNKTYVVNSTVNDQNKHPSGYYKSTIDINEDLPDGTIRSHNVSLNRSRNLRDEESFEQTELTTEKHRNVFKTEEKSVYYVRQESQQPNPHHVTKFRIHPSPDSGQGTEVASSDGENELHKQKFERVERIYEVKTEPVLPEQFQSEAEVSKDLRVLRGKILIKNRLDSDHDEDDFDQNVNVFDNSFHMDKDNPLYSSDTDLQASLQREEEEEIRKQINQDITFEQVNKIAHRNKSNSSKLEVSPKPRRKQNLSTLLLSKLANVDSQDIRQTIDVQHHNEEIFGNIDFIHADGEHTASQNTSNFDSVSEKVELTLQQGKAFVIIKVIAERIVPTDYEFNVWRKSQAIVTRQIEVDLLANDQRRRFYNHVMDSQGLPAAVEYHYDSDGRRQDRLTSHEKQLSSLETLKLFSQILDVADGQGDEDHTSMRTKQEMGQLPATGADLLY